MTSLLFLFVLPDVMSVLGSPVVAVTGFGFLSYTVHKVSQAKPHIKLKTKNSACEIDFPTRDNRPPQDDTK